MFLSFIMLTCNGTVMTSVFVNRACCRLHICFIFTLTSIIIDLFRNDHSKNINPLDLSINVYQKINIQNKTINYLYESYFRNLHFVLRKRLLSGTNVSIFRNLESKIIENNVPLRKLQFCATDIKHLFAQRWRNW
jgi:hypothetical protein